MKYLLGVDLGTSGTKTVLFNEKGEALASHTVEYPLYQPKNGWAEQNADDWFNAAVVSIKNVIAQAKVEAKDIVSLAIAGQMHGLVMLDKEGKPLRNAILWCDARTSKQCEEITNLVGKKRLIEINANPALTGFTAPKILWVRENEKDLYDKCQTILLPKDYVRFKLTGVKAMEISDASGTNLLDMRSRQWSSEILEKLSIDPSLLPPIIESSAVAGTITKEASELTSLCEGTIVAGGAGDNAAAALGTGVCKEGDAFVTLGTSGVIFAHTNKPSIDPLGRVHTFCAAVENSWTAMSCTLSAGLSLRWTRDQLFSSEYEKCKAEGKEVYDLMTAQAAQIPSGADGLIYLPYLMGERSPILDAQARGLFFGLNARHSKAHMVRAVLEGITLSQRHCLEVLHQMDIKPQSLTACGGGGASAMWRQMIADVLNCKVNTIASKEGPALGAAILAAVAVKLYPTVEKAVEVMVKRDANEAQPSASEVLRYNDIFELYQSLYPALRTSFHKLARLRDKLDGEKVEKYPSVFSVEFEPFGKVIEGIDTAQVTKLLDTLPCPTDKVTYVASEPVLETKELLDDVQNRVFGGLKVQIGYCSGHNRTLNALEYHRNCEINICGTDTIFMLAPVTAIKDGIIDTHAVETFFCPKGTAVQFYETALHYAPCSSEENGVFKVAVVLPKDTNTQKPEHLDVTKDSETSKLTANNKWLFAHKDSFEGKNKLSTGLLVGENLTL